MSSSAGMCPLRGACPVRLAAMVVAAFYLVVPMGTLGWEFSGYVAGESRLFANRPLYAGQDQDNLSAAGLLEVYHRIDDGCSLTFAGFARADTADPSRTHVDIRELNYLYHRDEYEVRVGIGKVFWGATEFVHLVDIVNQTDLVEHIDGEDKLGQPMLQFTLARGWGRVDVIMMPYFRERTFPGRSGRLRPQLVVDPDVVIYESPEAQRRWDFLIRYSHSIGPCDFGFYAFNGTDREPLLFPTTNGSGEPVLGSFYQEIDQLGLDLQYATANWLWKAEAIYKHGFFEGHFAATGGFEYTWVNLGQTGADVGLVVECAFDERGSRATTAYNHDAMLGLRISPNDAAMTYVLAGWIQDLKDGSNILVLETSRRFGRNWRLSLDLWTFLHMDRQDLLYGLRDDDFLRAELAYCF